MHIIRYTLLTLMFSGSAFVASNVSAQDNPDPGGDSGDEFTMIDAAVMAFETQADLKCTCEDPEDTSDLESCLKKMERKAYEATKNAVSFNRESKRELKTALAEASDDLLLSCSESGDTPDDSGGDNDLPG